MNFVAYAAKRTAKFWIIEPLVLLLLIPLLPLLWIASALVEMKIDFDKERQKAGSK